MPKVSIEQFRAALTGRSAAGTLLPAYRTLARRPDLAAGMVHNEWAIWQQTNAAGA
jgi:hypothetical protein